MAAALRRRSSSARRTAPALPPADEALTAGDLGGLVAATPVPSLPPRRPRSACDGRRSGADSRGLRRSHYLYQQALVTASENAQAKQEIKALKELEEMRECTFQPKVLPPRRGSSSPAPQPRHFEVAVARLRAAAQRRSQLREELQRVPCGENYERLRRLNVEPFSCYHRRQRSPRPQPLMCIDVGVGPGRSGRIQVREGDDLRTVARNFAKTFHLDRGMAQQLEDLLQEAVEAQHLVLALDDGVVTGTASSDSTAASSPAAGEAGAKAELPCSPPGGDTVATDGDESGDSGTPAAQQLADGC